MKTRKEHLEDISRLVKRNDELRAKISGYKQEIKELDGYEELAEIIKDLNKEIKTNREEMTKINDLIDTGQMTLDGGN